LQTTFAADAHLAEGQFLLEEQTLNIAKSLIIIIIIIIIIIVTTHDITKTFILDNLNYVSVSQPPQIIHNTSPK
jgi:hypothetical protein